MGSALYIVAEREILGFDRFVNGKALSLAEHKLATLASELGVASLMDFVSIAPAEAAAFMEEEDVAPDANELPDEKWHDAGAGIATVDALRKQISTAPDSIPDSAAVLSDLSEFRSVLRRLKSEGIRWHLAVDY